MSNLARVLCLLLIVTATKVFAWSILTPVRRSFMQEMAFGLDKINSIHKNAYFELAYIKRKVKEEYGRESAREYPSTDMRQAVVECFEDYLKLIEDRQRRLNATGHEAFRRVKLNKVIAKSCVPKPCSFILFPKIRAFFCIKKVQASSSRIVERVEVLFSGVMKNLKIRHSRLVKSCRKAAKEAHARSEGDTISSEESQASP